MFNWYLQSSNYIACYRSLVYCKLNSLIPWSDETDTMWHGYIYVSCLPITVSTMYAILYNLICTSSIIATLNLSRMHWSISIPWLTWQRSHTGYHRAKLAMGEGSSSIFHPQHWSLKSHPLGVCCTKKSYCIYGCSMSEAINNEHRLLFI